MRNTGSLATSSLDGRRASHHTFIATATGSLSSAPGNTSEKIAAEMTADGGTLLWKIRTGMTTTGSPATSGTLGGNAKKMMAVPTPFIQISGKVGGIASESTATGLLKQ